MKNLFITAIFLLTPTLSFANLIIDANGQLLGAERISYNNNVYSVMFEDQTTSAGNGSCVDVFNGCDSSEFAFDNQTDAEGFALAMFDQMLTGLFDTDPSLTFGCSSDLNCLTRIPFAVNLTSVTQTVLVNSLSESNDGVFSETLAITNPTTFNNVNFARVELVPSPSLSFLSILFLGMLCLRGNISNICIKPNK